MEEIVVGHTEEPLEIEQVDLEKQQKNEQKSKQLLNRILTGQIEDIWDRVAYILNNHDSARNSDPELAWLYWRNFENDLFGEGITSSEQFRKLTKFNSITRVRAKIQNEYKLFQADERVRKYRGKLEEDKRDEALEDRPPGIGQYSVFIDETGKNQRNLSVGSLWLLRYESSTMVMHADITKWKLENGINYEFHFSQLSRHKVEHYQQFLIRFLSYFPEAGFKLIVINNAGHDNTQQVITDLTVHLIIDGIRHENETGRAPLPRVLQLWIDEDDTGRDQLKIANIRERIRAQKMAGLHIGDIAAVASESNFHIQITDLFTGAINRKLHPGDDRNFKDDFADFVLDTIGFDAASIDQENTEIDNATVFNLR